MDQKSENKTIVCCFDGTGNRFGENSNIVRLFDVLVKGNPKQVVYYQPGIGTYSKQQYYTAVATTLVSKINETAASSFHDHVMQGYTFIMQNYKTGDKISLFGFSRGAFVARVLMGMIYKVGLLPANNVEQVKLAYTMYQATDENGYKLSQKFKKTHSMHVTIDFVGVWDTVSSVGFFSPKGKHPYVSMNYATKVFRHALALDERRILFQPRTWGQPLPDSEQEHDSYSPQFRVADQQDYVPPDRDYADVKEVWFAGSHADVGGGSHHYRRRHSLSNISLRWMIQEAKKANCGIMFADLNDLETLNLEAKSVLDPDYSTESDDILEPIFDQLAISPMWWISELLPLLAITQAEDGSWVRANQCNLGAGRVIPCTTEESVLVHKSVEQRMVSGYTPAASNWNALSKRIQYIS